jgi:3-dehydroquinate dehydratase/shikimate dehydrogenase
VTGRLDEAFEVLCKLGLAGASVTIPHKVRASELAAELDEEARNARSVNTLYRRDGAWRGANTDIAAITVLAERLGSRSGQKALILGTGGFARAGAWALADMGINVVLLGRRLLEEPGPWEDCLPLESLGEVPFHILFNATPVNGSAANGKKANGSLFPKGLDLQGKIVIDGVLSPKATNLVKKARTAKSRIGTGADIWVEQGARQLELFGCPSASPDELKDLVHASRKVYLPRRKKKTARKSTSRG